MNCYKGFCDFAFTTFEKEEKFVELHHFQMKMIQIKTVELI